MTKKLKKIQMKVPYKAMLLGAMIKILHDSNKKHLNWSHDVVRQYFTQKNAFLGGGNMTSSYSKI